MGEVRKNIQRVKLFCGMISSEPGLFEKAIRDLQGKFGPLDSRSALFDFNQTSYYEDEMGMGLKRMFISFKKLIPRERIIRAKLETNKMEIRLSKSGDKRKINLDPGYMSSSNVSLATTKDYQHRIYLGKGIFLENTLRMRKGHWEDWEWTYPDYKTVEYKKWFAEIHELFKQELKDNPVRS